MDVVPICARWNVSAYMGRIQRILLSYGNRISPQFPILLITDCLFSNYLESPERQYYYNQTIIHKEE